MQVRQNKLAWGDEKLVDNFVEMVDLTYKLVQKFSTKNMFERINLVEKLQNNVTYF